MKNSSLPALAAAGAALLVLATALGLTSSLLTAAEETPSPPSGAPGSSPTTAPVRLAEGFDFPVGWPEAVGYHKARGFRPNGHLGEDWDGDGGGNTDFGDPIYCAANGIVVWARDVRMGWGNVIIVRHGFRDPAANGGPGVVDTLYGHLDSIGVREGQQVTRGQRIATMGDNHGMYDAHLHFEVRKNLAIGMNRSAYARDFSNYYDPTQFIQEHRTLRGGVGRIVINTFAPYPSGGGGDTVAASDGAYELGTLRGPGVVTQPLAGKSAYELQRRARTGTTGNPNFDQFNKPFQVDRFGEVRK